MSRNRNMNPGWKLDHKFLHLADYDPNALRQRNFQEEADGYEDQNLLCFKLSVLPI